MKDLLNQYVLGDAFNFFPLLPEHSVDLIFTSVPDLSEVRKLAKSPGAYVRFLDAALTQMARIIKPRGFLALCQTDRRLRGRILCKHLAIMNGLQSHGIGLKDYKILVTGETINLYRLSYSHLLILTRRGTIKASKRKGAYLKDVWHFPCQYRGTLLWNEDFTDLIIQTLSDKGHLVMDPFAGRGTVLRSARRHGRRFFGTEIDQGIYQPDFVFG